MTNIECQFLECHGKPEFHIFAVNQNTNAAAGPDPYADETFSCTEHVGPLLGHQPEAEDTDNIYWQVRAVTEMVPA